MGRPTPFKCFRVPNCAFELTVKSVSKAIIGVCQAKVFLQKDCFRNENISQKITDQVTEREERRIDAKEAGLILSYLRSAAAVLGTLQPHSKCQSVSLGPVFVWQRKDRVYRL